LIHAAAEERPEDSSDEDADDDEEGEHGGRDKADCHTAVRGEACHKAVAWAMEHGIDEHPDWYPGLNKGSGFEEFQHQIHLLGSKKEGKHEEKCKAPCACHTSTKGEDCYERVAWAITHGIFAHPEWYKNLTTTSRFEEFQRFLHLHVPNKTSECPMPCTPRPWESPSIFCFAVFRAQGYEPDLMRAQLNKGAGIFACDEYAIVSDDHLTLGQGPQGPVEAMVIPSTKVGVSKDGTAANTQVFMNAWHMVSTDFRFRFHDWILKVDPDAVLLPSRLRQHLTWHQGPSVYLKNCGRFSGPGWPAMYGAVEAFTRQAILTYFANAHRCRDELQWQTWGEDVFMAACMDHLGVAGEADLDLVGDGVCMGANCGEGAKAAFHPFKSPEKWLACWDQAHR
jgi:hypothetical protein